MDLSSTKVEYHSLATTTAKIIWLRCLAQEFDINTSIPIPLYYDNISTLSIASNPIFHARTNHIEIDYHLIMECIQQNIIS